MLMLPVKVKASLANQRFQENDALCPVCLMFKNLFKKVVTDFQTRMAGPEVGLIKHYIQADLPSKFTTISRGIKHKKIPFHNCI